MADQSWWRRGWDFVSDELLGGPRSLGAFLHRGGLTLAFVEKGLTTPRLHRLTHLDGAVGQLGVLAPALRELAAAWTPDRIPANLAVSRELGFWRRAKLPAAAAENLAQVVAYELDRFFPLPAAALYYDFLVMEETAGHLDLALMGVPREPVDDCLELLRQVGFQVAGAELETTAAANAFALAAGKLPSAWLLMHLQPQGLEVAVLKRGALRACQQFSDDNLRDLPALLQTAWEPLGREAETPGAVCLYGPRDRCRKAAARVEAAGFKAFTPARLQLTGDPAEADPGTALPALGAALRTFKRPPLAANLLPAESRDRIRPSAFSLNKVSLMVFLGLLVLWAGSLLIHKRVALFQVNRQLAGLSPEARQLEQLLRESRTLAEQFKTFRQKLGQYPDRLKIIRELTRLIPDHTYIFHLRLSQQHVEISGLSKSASDLIPLLDQSGWLTKTEFASPIVIDASKLEHFKIKAEIKSVESGS
ncbi:MAG: PilN domain-containing protein [Deltaproteobacteria bacterium]|nr:PilN domain-containing protein [Deltaproteobacteria bacterium]